jgi:hypothetical protein
LACELVPLEIPGTEQSKSIIRARGDKLIGKQANPIQGSSIFRVNKSKIVKKCVTSWYEGSNQMDIIKKRGRFMSRQVHKISSSGCEGRGAVVR